MPLRLGASRDYARVDATLAGDYAFAALGDFDVDLLGDFDAELPAEMPVAVDFGFFGTTPDVGPEAGLFRLLCGLPVPPTLGRPTCCIAPGDQSMFPSGDCLHNIQECNGAFAV